MAEPAPVTAEDILAFTARLAATLPGADVERIDQLQALTRLSNAIAGRQARIGVAFEDSQRATAAAAGVPMTRQGRGIATQISMAMRTRPHQAQRFLATSRRLLDHLPTTTAALTSGRIPWIRAEAVATGTEGLPPETQEDIDEQLGQQPTVLEDAPISELGGTIRSLADAHDPGAANARRATARAGRRVTLRPDRDGMAWLSTLLPVEQGVAVYAALRAEAEKQVAAGQAGGVHHAMTDTLVQRVTGAASAEAIPVAVNLVMTDTALLHGGTDPARLEGHGPVPASLGRDLVRRGLDKLDQRDKLDEQIKLTLRRLYANPRTGQLVAMESRARLFPKALAGFIAMRDQYCRTPSCGNRIRHTDHIRAHADGGPRRAATVKAPARTATTPNKPPAGPPASSTPAPVTTRWRSPPPPATATTADHPPSPHPHLQRPLASRLGRRRPRTSTTDTFRQCASTSSRVRARSASRSHREFAIVRTCVRRKCGAARTCSRSRRRILCRGHPSRGCPSLPTSPSSYASATSWLGRGHGRRAPRSWWRRSVARSAVTCWWSTSAGAAARGSSTGASGDRSCATTTASRGSVLAAWSSASSRRSAPARRDAARRDAAGRRRR